MVTKDSHVSSVPVPELNYDIRAMVWALFYKAEAPRIVEIRTKKHESCEEHEEYWCPRYSPSPNPAVVNICKEARLEARRIAGISGHLFLSGDQPSASCPIYFNPEKDTLSIHNDKNYWIRDWFGGHGILTQLKDSWQPERLRVLAIDLEPINRATNERSFRNDLNDFKNLGQVIFTVTKHFEIANELVHVLSLLPRHMNREYNRAREIGRLNDSGWMMSRSGDRGRRYCSTQLRECLVAVRDGVEFKIIKRYKC